MNKDVIIALDFSSLEEVDKFLLNFEDLDEKPFVKVGMELFYKEGQSIVKYLKNKGYKIFLDLKLHDIPITVKKTLEVLKELDIDIINVHALGGTEMLKVAQDVFKNTTTLIIGVTILTSLDDKQIKELGFGNDVDQTVLNLAKICKNEKLNGIVCSCFEVEQIKEHIGDDFITITPGIRLEDDLKDDQKRVVTPLVAKEINTDYIVVGRTITKSLTPLQTYQKIKKQFLGE